MRGEEITFKKDRFTLSGVFMMPDGSGPHPAAIFIHGDGPINRDASGFYIPLWEGLTQAGCACLSWDKPGAGKSTGEYSRSQLFHERAFVALEAVRFLKNREDINPKRIGFWGISQAGYVMPLAISQTDDISFMITVSCPGMSGVEQSAFLVESQLTHKGMPLEEARRYRESYIKRAHAKSYEEYLRFAKPLSEQPYIRSELKWGEIIPEDEYAPRAPDDEGFLDPVPILQTITCPVLAIFGEKDTQIPAKESAEAYRLALTKAGNKRFTIKMFPDADHFISRTHTGSMEEIKERFLNKRFEYAPGYIDTMVGWLMDMLAFTA